MDTDRNTGPDCLTVNDWTYEPTDGLRRWTKEEWTIEEGEYFTFALFYSLPDGTTLLIEDDYESPEDAYIGYKYRQEAMK